ncbi:MAG: hypothetical protein E4H26_01570 [Flavobacteriales bacterium]|nr:MAG: hypothetical protein E4H26_01570 [Flavobacteriales bacterium]
MKKLMTGILAILFISTGFSLIDDTVEQDNNILQKVADANGFQNWKKVTELKFTFNVDRDGKHFERSWIWNPRNNDITAIGEEGTIKYNWANMDSTAKKTNGNFINDKYWMLAPFQLVWDGNNITHKYTSKATAPISKKPMQKITIHYGAEGGYTPGDAYDFYFGDDLIVREWVYRKGNQVAPSVVTTWEDYVDLNGIKIAKTHKNAEGNFKLHFTGLEVKTN